MRFRKFIPPVLAGFTSLIAVATARADIVTVYGWRTTEEIANSATGATPASLLLPTCHKGIEACVDASNVPQNADVGFFLKDTLPNFDIEYDGTVTEWLTSGGVTPVKNLLSGVDDYMSATIWLFRGSITIKGDEKFTIYHDDGVSIMIDGHLWAQPGAVSPGLDVLSIDLATQYTGPVGSVPFELVYAECCGGPARLVMTPEPAGILLLVTVLGVLAPVVRRKITS